MGRKTTELPLDQARVKVRRHHQQRTALQMSAFRQGKKPPHGAHTHKRERDRLSLSIIGAGRLGAALGRALTLAGHRIDVVVTNHAASARRAAAIIDRQSISVSRRQLEGSEKALQSLAESDVLILATPDDAIQSTAEQLAAMFQHAERRKTRRARTALHTSGALSSEVLAPLRNAEFSVGSMHPLVSIAGSSGTKGIFRGAYFCVEGDSRASRVARAIVKQLGGLSFTVLSESKPLYHAAAAMSSGHVVALIDLAIGMLEQCGLPPRRARQVLLPLVESTVKNLATKAPAKALTGPFARGDYATAQKHLEAMDRRDLAEAARVYAWLGVHALKLARTAGTNSQQLDRIEKLLASRTREL